MTSQDRLLTDLCDGFTKMYVVHEMIETDKERRGNAVEEWHSPSYSVTMSTNAGGAEHSDKTSE